MDDQPTCGKGLAAHAVLPAKLGDLTTAVAQILEAHMKALDLEDVNARKEHDAYRRLAQDHRRIAADLQETARQMAGYRDLPMGRHDEKVMADPQHRHAFEQFVSLESELAELLETRLQQDRKMLIAMR